MLVFVAIAWVDLASRLLGQCVINSFLLFHRNVDLTREHLGYLRQSSALMKPNSVELPLTWPSAPSYPMTATQPAIHPSSLAQLDYKCGELVFWLLIVHGVLVLDLYSIT